MKTGKIFDDEFWKVIIAKTGDISILQKDGYQKKYDKKIILPKHVADILIKQYRRKNENE